MNETLSTEFDVEVEEEGPVRVEVEIPDDKRQEFLRNLRLEDPSEDDAPQEVEIKKAEYESWGEMQAVVGMRDGSGIWLPLQCMKGRGEINVQDLKKFGKEAAAIERSVRAKNKKYRKPGKDGKLPALPPEVTDNIFVLASFGTALCGWRGEGFVDENGKPIEFNVDNYRWAFENVYEFKTELIDKLNGVNASVLEEVRKNS